MKTLARDTSPEAEKVLIELWRKATPARKIAMVLSANRTARALAMTGLRARHPGESPERLRRRLADLWLGPELATKAYGPLTEDWPNDVFVRWRTLLGKHSSSDAENAGGQSRKDIFR